MNPAAIAALSATTVIIVQQLKWMGLSRRYAGVATAFVSACSMLLWIWSESAFVREAAFDHFAMWAVVWAAAVGVFKVARQPATQPAPVPPGPEPGP